VKVILIILKKDLHSFFSRPLFYLLAGLCTLIWSPVYIYSFGMFLSQLVSVMGTDGEFISYHDRVVIEFASLVNFMILIFSGGITMKLLAEEKKNHTYELLITSPIKSWQIAVAKYVAGMIVVSVLLLISLMYPISSAFLGKILWWPLLSTYVGLWLFAAVYVGIGLLGSSLSSSVIMAFMISLILNLSLWFLAVGTEMSSTESMARVFDYINLEPIFKDFSLGVMRSTSVVYLLTLSGIALICSERVIESSRWR